MPINRLKKISSKSGVNFIVLLIVLSFVISGLSSFVFFLKNYNQNCFFSIKNKCLDDKIRIEVQNFVKENNIRLDDQEITSRIIKRKISNEILEIILEDLNFAISNEYILENIKKDNLFKENNVFSLEKFNQFLKTNNLTEEKYFKEMKLFITNHIVSSLFAYDNKNFSINNVDKDFIDFYTKKYIFSHRKYHILEYYKNLNDITINNIKEEQIVNEYQQSSNTISELKEAEIIVLKNKDKINFKGKTIEINKDNISLIVDYINEKIESEDLSFFKKRFKVTSQKIEFYSDKEINNYFDSQKLLNKNIVKLDKNLFERITKKNKLYLDVDKAENKINIYCYISSKKDVKLPLEMINKDFIITKIKDDLRRKIVNQAFQEENFKFFEKRNKIIEENKESDNILVQIIKNNELKNDGKIGKIFLKTDNSIEKNIVSFFFLEEITYNSSVSEENLLSFIKEIKDKESIMMDQSYNNYIYDKYNIKIK